MLVKVRECCCDLPSSEVPTYYPTTAKSSECGKLAEFCKKIGRFSDFGNFASLCITSEGKGNGEKAWVLKSETSMHRLCAARFVRS